MFTHNEVTALLWFVVFASGGVIGAIVAWSRVSYRLGECCDCCTCEDCYEEVMPVEPASHDWVQMRPLRETAFENAPWPGQDAERGTGRSITGPGRRTIVLEPGPTIYRALVPLDDESPYGPESHVKPFDSTFIRTVLMDWERRYPIPQDSPNGNM